MYGAVCSFEFIERPELSFKRKHTAAVIPIDQRTIKKIIVVNIIVTFISLAIRPIIIACVNTTLQRYKHYQVTFDMTKRRKKNGIKESVAMLRRPAI